MSYAIVPFSARAEIRIQVLSATTIADGCTEDVALSAASAQVAELLDRHALAPSEIELRRCLVS